MTSNERRNLIRLVRAAFTQHPDDGRCAPYVRRNYEDHARDCGPISEFALIPVPTPDNGSQLEFEIAIVDRVDHEAVAAVKWRYAGIDRVVTKDPARKTTTAMGLFIWGLNGGDVPEGLVVDHISRNTFDNRRSNLRLLTVRGNLKNSSRPVPQSGYTGVYLNGKSFVARTHDGSGKKIVVFRHEDPRLSALAYDEAVRRIDPDSRLILNCPDELLPPGWLLRGLDFQASYRERDQTMSGGTGYWFDGEIGMWRSVFRYRSLGASRSRSDADRRVRVARAMHRRGCPLDSCEKCVNRNSHELCKERREYLRDGERPPKKSLALGIYETPHGWEVRKRGTVIAKGRTFEEALRFRK